MKDRRVLRLFIVNWVAGALLGCAFAAGLLLADLGGLRSLILRSDIALPALFLLFGGFAVTCGSVLCGSAVMRLGARDDEGRHGGGVAPSLQPVAVVVRAGRQP